MMFVRYSCFLQFFLKNKLFCLLFIAGLFFRDVTGSVRKSPWADSLDEEEKKKYEEELKAEIEEGLVMHKACQDQSYNLIAVDEIQGKKEGGN